MPSKKRQFRDKPRVDNYGQYTYIQGNVNANFEDSDSTPRNWDKFLDKDLYTSFIDDGLNEQIVQSMIDYPDGNAGGKDYLKYNVDTFVRFDEIVLERNANIPWGIKDIDVKVYMFSAYAYAQIEGPDDDGDGEPDYYITHDDRPFRSPYNFDDNGDETPELKIWEEYYYDLWRTSGAADAWPDDPNNNRDPGEIAIIMNKRIPGLQEGLSTGPIPEFSNYTLLTNLSATYPNYPTWNDTNMGGNFYTTQKDAADNHHNIDVPEAEHLGALMVKPGAVANQVTQIFQEDGQYNPIYIVVSHRGDASVPGGGNDYARKDRIHIFKINPSDLFIYYEDGTVVGKETSFAFTENDGITMDEELNQSPVAQTLTSLKLTINTYGYGDLIMPDEYAQYFPLISAPKPPVDLENLDERFIDLNPSNEIFHTNRINVTADVSEFSDWTPFSRLTLVDNQHDLQAFYDDFDSKLKSSAPTTIELDFGIAGPKNLISDGTELVDRSLPLGIKIGYAFYVVSWDDAEGKFETFDDVRRHHPFTVNTLLKYQEKNTYKIGLAGVKSLKHSYASAGIKKIKVVMFNYQKNEDKPNLAEPIRWKLITIRHFLDIPKNEYPEFGELGGDNYTTIPWPFTSAVIGGISRDSKYYSSIEKTLNGGKIGENDIIDETFLLDAVANDELGKNIETMDLEQIRFFNSSYDMNKLLGIDSHIAINLPSGPTDESPAYLATLPYPQYFEEFNGNPDVDDILQALDAVYWASDASRPDIGTFIVAWVHSGGGSNVEMGLATLNNSIYTFPEYVYSYIENHEVPLGDGQQQELEYFHNIPDLASVNLFYPYTSGSYWNGETKFYSDYSSVGQIFINDNTSVDLKDHCKIEYNLGSQIGKTLYDSSGHANQGMIIGDYRIKKSRKNEPMGRDSVILVPKKQTTDGAL